MFLGERVWQLLLLPQSPHHLQSLVLQERLEHTTFKQRQLLHLSLHPSVASNVCLMSRNVTVLFCFSFEFSPVGNSRRPSRPSNNSTSAPLIQDKPYVCPRCGRCYSRRGALIQHQRYECGIEPQFSCPMCPYKIKRKDSLNRHIRNMHHNQNTN